MADPVLLLVRNGDLPNRRAVMREGMGRAFDVVDVPCEGEQHGVWPWMQKNRRKPVATMNWEEHGYRFACQALTTYVVWAREQGIAPLSFDKAYFDHGSAWIVDRYEANGHSKIDADWPGVSDAPMDWARYDPRLRAYVNTILGRIEEAKRLPPLREPGYVMFWGQFDRLLARNGFESPTWADFLGRLKAQLASRGLRLVVKFGPLGPKNEGGDLSAFDIVPHNRRDKLLNARLMVNAAFNVVVCSSVSNELCLAGAPVVALGKTRFSHKGVFAEPQAWEQIGQVPEVNAAARNKWMRWWAENQCYPEQVAERVKSLLLPSKQTAPQPREHMISTGKEAPEVVIHCRHADGMIALFNRLGVYAVEGKDNRARFAGDKTAHIWWGAINRQNVNKRDPLSWGAENGWFPQKDGIHLDKQGTNAESSLVGIVRPDTPILHDHAEWVRGLKQRFDADTRPADAPDEPFLFVALQEERDWNMKDASLCQQLNGHRGAWFVNLVCKTFPDQRIVFRQHPKDLNPMVRALPCIARHGRATFSQTGNSYQWANAATWVVSVSSTVLLEAMVLGKPVAAFGRGVFTGNGAVLECLGNADKMRQILKHKPYDIGVRRFASLLRGRQVPLDLTPERIGEFPALAALMQAIGKYKPERSRYGPHRREVCRGIAAIDKENDREITSVTCVYAPTAESENVTMQCLEALRRAAPEMRRIACIDLASESAMERIKALGFEVVTLEAGAPPRMMSLVRKALGSIETPYALFVESDVIFSQETIRYLANCIRAQKQNVVAVECATTGPMGEMVYPAIDRINANDIGRIVGDPMYPTFSGVLWKVDALKTAEWPRSELRLADKQLWDGVLARNPRARAVIHTCAKARHFGCVSRNAAKALAQTQPAEGGKAECTPKA